MMERTGPETFTNKEKTRTFPRSFLITYYRWPTVDTSSFLIVSSCRAKLKRAIRAARARFPKPLMFVGCFGFGEGFVRFGSTRLAGKRAIKRCPSGEPNEVTKERLRVVALLLLGR
ncbi:hypothetical protein GWI33_020347 [Rhynchophorus ferrugineus]|uniref:Uncharacterized protein n=1 Tax=Rhynchophorus ferrugineus TaxID=354439 RepID=A0A834HQS2_RHYFE|nr:hypothetical protein GWI33_020347 [Rhynchophorus ferrugineus]